MSKFKLPNPAISLDDMASNPYDFFCKIPAKCGNNTFDHAGKGGARSPSVVRGTGGVDLAKEGDARSPSAVSGTGGVELTYNALGLVTVFVTWSSCTSEGKEPLMNQTAITQKV